MAAADMMSDDQFLEEQIARLRRLTERMSQMHRGVAEISRLISRDREMLVNGPLHQVRDFRNVAALELNCPASTELAEERPAVSSPRRRRPRTGRAR